MKLIKSIQADLIQQFIFDELSVKPKFNDVVNVQKLITEDDLFAMYQQVGATKKFSDCADYKERRANGYNQIPGTRGGQFNTKIVNGKFIGSTDRYSVLVTEQGDTVFKVEEDKWKQIEGYTDPEFGVIEPLVDLSGFIYEVIEDDPSYWPEIEA